MSPEKIVIVCFWGGVLLDFCGASLLFAVFFLPYPPCKIAPSVAGGTPGRTEVQPGRRADVETVG